MRELSGVVKYYLRNLPEPLLTFDLYSQFLNVLSLFLFFCLFLYLSLFFYHIFTYYVGSSSTPDRDAVLYKALIRSLPAPDKVCLFFYYSLLIIWLILLLLKELLQRILSMLNDISKNSEVNKMSPSNLAIVFGPSLLRPQSVNAASELFDIFILLFSLSRSFFRFVFVLFCFRFHFVSFSMYFLFFSLLMLL